MATGYYIGARRELLAFWRERAETAEREHALAAERARAAERTRIAREMHDVLAHRISLVALHAGALTYRSDLDREETAAAAAVIQDNAHLALGELRQVLGVLRAGETAAPSRRSPRSPTCRPSSPTPTRPAPGCVADTAGLPGRGPGRPGRAAADRLAHGLPHRPGGADQRPQARPRRARSASGSPAAPAADSRSR